jgi:hypothetical protein
MRHMLNPLFKKNLALKGFLYSPRKNEDGPVIFQKNLHEPQYPCLNARGLCVSIEARYELYALNDPKVYTICVDGVYKEGLQTKIEVYALTEEELLANIETLEIDVLKAWAAMHE